MKQTTFPTMARSKELPLVFSLTTFSYMNVGPIEQKNKRIYRRNSTNSIDSMEQVGKASNYK